MSMVIKDYTLTHCSYCFRKLTHSNFKGKIIINPFPFIDRSCSRTFLRRIRKTVDGLLPFVPSSMLILLIMSHRQRNSRTELMLKVSKSQNDFLVSSIFQKTNAKI